MATMQTRLTVSTMNFNGATEVSQTVNFTPPTLPQGATITGISVVGTANITITRGSLSYIRVNDINAGITGTINVNLSSTSLVNSIAIKIAGANKNSTGAVSFVIDYVVTYDIVIDATSVSLDKKFLELEVGQTSRLTATILPSDTTDKTLRWSSSNNSIATVNEGLITTVSTGIAVITVTTKNGLTDTCQVDVLEPTITSTIMLGMSKVNSIYIGSEQIRNIYVGDSQFTT